MAELTVKIKVIFGKVYAENHVGKALIGEGYDVLVGFISELTKGSKEPVDVETVIGEWVNKMPEINAPIDVVVRVRDDFDFGERKVEYYVTQEYIIENYISKLPEVAVMEPIIEAPEPELPPYRPKLYSYDKRRKFCQKNNWNRIRSRCFK